MAVYPVVYEPTGIEARGNVALYFVPAIKDINAPTLAELNAGVNLSKVAYRWDVNGSQDSNERGHYASRNSAKSLGRVHYDPSELEYDYDPQKMDTPDDEYKHVKSLEPGTKGFIVDRRGLPAETEFQADQILEAVIPCELGERFPVEAGYQAEEGSKLRYRQQVSVTGDVARTVKVKQGV